MRKNRVLIGVLGLDQHEVGAVGIARMLRDEGMEVVYIGTFNVPKTIVRAAIQEGVDLIGLSCHSWEYLHYIPELMELLEKEDLRIPVVVGGSVITAKDGEEVLKMGVAAAFGPSSTNMDIIDGIDGLIKKHGNT
ncbi:MAG: methylmalonyl-CoA mutase [Proteobacteria bacterium]|nr:methylmalonyl-CoA mutase [Pseudomonadota bacterium]